MVLYPSLYQVNTRVWLRELANALGRPATLADIPDAFLDQSASQGFNYIWFLGLWQTGPAGRQVSLSQPEWLREFQATLPDFTEADVCERKSNREPLVAVQKGPTWFKK